MLTYKAYWTRQRVNLGWNLYMEIRESTLACISHTRGERWVLRSWGDWFGCWILQENPSLRIWGIALEVRDNFAELGEDLSLAQREFRIFCLVIKGDDHVLNLKRCKRECKRREQNGDTSSPQRSSSPCLSLTLSQLWRNWVIPCSLTWSAYTFASSHVRGVPRYRRPML